MSFLFVSGNKKQISAYFLLDSCHLVTQFISTSTHAPTHSKEKEPKETNMETTQKYDNDLH